MAGERSGQTSLIDPIYVFRRVWASKSLIALTTFLGIALAILLALSTPKLYTADTQILVDPRDIKVVQNEVTPNGLPNEATLALIESQIAVVYSNNVLNRVIDEAGLESDPEFNGTGETLFGSIFPNLVSFLRQDDVESGRQRLVTLKNLRKAMTVTRDAKSFIINLAVETRDPEKSAELSRLIGATFIDQLGRVQSQTARRASDALSSRLAELRQSVADAERAVEEYKTENRLVGVGGRLVDDDYILRTNDQLARSRGEMAALRVRAEQMKNVSIDDVVKGSFPEELTSEALTRLRNTYSELAQQAAVLSTTLGPRHPQRLASQEALASARNAIRAELNRIVAAAQTDLTRAEQTDRDLTEQITALKTKQLATSESFVKLRELEREVEASRAVYEAFLLRARETGEQESLNTANVHVISEATPPLEPSSLARRTMVLLGAVLGFLAGVGIAVLRATVLFFQEGRPFDRIASDSAPVAVGFEGAGYRGRAAYAPGFYQTAGLYSAAPLGIGAGREAGDADAVAAGEAAQADTAGIRPAVYAETGELRRPSDEAGEPSRNQPESDNPVGTSPVDGERLASEEDADPKPSVDLPDSPDGGAESASADDVAQTREELRQKIRAIAAERPEIGDQDNELGQDDAEVERLQLDIAAVKRHIAEIRERRQVH
ncbi:GumC family protein [Aurantimonas marianensis]|uniref:GumC family protein n=1 Tax=Aurantimonas marianensis TaxID=2920428 RepID=A0A9X2H4P1_9HYPH|nr:GumC family protein [Aurantimonas marianensis]MCP3053720.1 GumC family protein [Aurantimonas marianensis]